MKKLTLALALVLLGSCAVWAGSICPAGSGASPFVHSPDPSATGCNVVITVNANNSVTITIPDSSPYDGSEDTLIGVVNNSSGALTSLSLSGSDIFGFDGDGICTFTFVGSTYCNASQRSGTDPGDYQGPLNTFTVTNANTGSVNFNPAVAANGGTTYFSLEGTPTASLTATPTTGPSTSASAPALSPWGMAMLTVLLLGLSVRMLKYA